MSKIGDVIVKLLLKSDEYDKGLGKAKKSTESFGKDMVKGFGRVAGAVTAVVGAIAGISKVLEKVSSYNQTFGDKWQSMCAGMKGAWNEVATSVATLDFSGLISRMREAASVARDLYSAVDAMGEVTTAYNIASAEEAKHLAQLRVEMNDPNASYDARIKAANEYLAISKKLADMPLFGLGKVEDATITKYMSKMGYDFSGKTQKQIDAAKKSYVDFFKWLGTQQGLSALDRIQNADAANGELARASQALMNKGVNQNWVTWLKTYADRMNDENRTELESAIVAFLKADADYDIDTRKVQNLLNTLEYNKSKKGAGSGKPEKDPIKKKADELRASMEEFKPLVMDASKLLNGVGAVAQDMPDLITDEWLQRQQEQAAKMSAWLEDLVYKTDTVASDLGNAVQNGIVSAIDELAEALGSGEGIDGGAVVKALLSPLADACISAGLLIMTSGEAIEALRESLLSGLATGGISAIAAGAGLMAVGAAAKVGLAAIGSGKSSGSGYSTAAASGSADTQNIESELTIFVKGTIKGSDIVIAGNKTVSSWAR